MDFLVGYSGFVGSNISKNMHFDGLFDHKNVENAFGKNPDLLIYAGVRAEKFLANANDEQDLQIVMNAFENIVKIAPKQLVLISSIDVNEQPYDANENTLSNVKNMQPYGKNRYILEEKIRETFPNALIVRLPALFGQNLKKNFIYDILNPVPKTLSADLMKKFNSKVIYENYMETINGFYSLKFNADLNGVEKELKLHNFSSLNFTDSRSSYQFYNLNYLVRDLKMALKNGIKLLNICSEPITAKEIIKFCYDKDFNNEMNKPLARYDITSIHYQLFNGQNGYLYNKESVLNDLKNYLITEQITFSLSNLAFGLNTNPVCALLKQYGFKSIEIAPTIIEPNNPYKNTASLINYVQELKNNYDINICSMQSIWFNITEKMFGENANREFLLNHTKQAIDLANQIGIKTIVFGCPKNRNIYSQQDIILAQQFFLNLGDYAQNKNVVICIEPNPEIYGTNFINTTEQAIGFVKKLKHPNIKINLDFGTIIANNENLDIVKNNIKLIGHIHISEPMLDLIQNRAQHKELANILFEKEYKGAVSIEMKTQTLENINKTLKYVRATFTKE